jgi:hypothetical protein
MIEFSVTNNAGVFQFDETNGWKKANDDISTLEIDLRKGKVGFSGLSKAIDKIIKEFPSLLRAYQTKTVAAIGIMTDMQMKPSRTPAGNAGKGYRKMYDIAFETCKTGLILAERQIPPDYNGTISCDESSNIPFLLLHHSKILLHLLRGNYAGAAWSIEEHLRWNPSDCLGVRFLLGACYYNDGEKAKAFKCMREEEDNCVQYRYTLALLDIETNDFITAAVRLRKAFLENAYIAETLVYGHDIPKNHYLFEPARESYHAVDEYRKQEMLSTWHANQAAMDFVRWLYNTSTAIFDRADLMKQKEFLTYVPISETEVRERAVANIHKIFDNITGESTAHLIRKVETRRSGCVWPWEWGMKQEE